METTVKDVLDCLKRLEEVKEKLKESADLIGDNNISHGLCKEDCEFVANVIANEINRLNKLEVKI